MSEMTSQLGSGHVSSTWENLSLHHQKVLTPDGIQDEQDELAVLEGKIRDVKTLDECHTSTEPQTEAQQEPHDVAAKDDSVKEKGPENMVSDAESKVSLVVGLVKDVIDTLQDEHSAKLRLASINVILTALYTHTDRTLTQIEESMGLKYFMDEWLVDTDYNTLRRADRKVWALGLIALIRPPSHHYRAITDIPERIITTTLHIINQMFDEIQSCDGRKDSSTITDQDDDTADEETTTKAECRQLAEEKADDNRAKPEDSVNTESSKDAMSKETTSNIHRTDIVKQSAETAEAASDDITAKSLKSDSASYNTKLECEDAVLSDAESDEGESTFSDTISDGESDNYYDPELMNYYEALEKANICSCCLPAAFIKALKDCSLSDPEWYIQLISNLDTEARIDLRMLEDMVAADNRIRHYRMGDFNAEPLRAETPTNDLPVVDAKSTHPSNSLEDTTREPLADSGSNQHGTSGTGSPTKATHSKVGDTQDGEEDQEAKECNHGDADDVYDDDFDYDDIVFSPVPAVRAVTRYFKYLKL